MSDIILIKQAGGDKVAVNPAPVTIIGQTLVPATNATLGGIIVGDNLTITGNGVLSAQPGGVTAFNNRTGNVSLTENDVTTLVNANYLQVYKDTQANESTLTQFGLSSFLQSTSLGSGYSRGLLTSNLSGTTTRSIFDGNVYQSSAAARYPAYKRIAFNSNNTSGANSTGRIQVNDYGAVFIDSQTATSGSNISRVSAFSVGSAQSFQNVGDILLTSPGVSFYANKSNRDGSNCGTEQGSFVVGEMQRGISGPSGYISRPYTISLESRNTWPVADTTISYPYTPNYRTFMTIGDSAELFFQHLGNQTDRTPTWTSNSILTQGYADTRYQAVGAYLTSANLTYANLTNTPTTLAGYGITDGLTSANLTPYLTISSANATYAVLGHTHSIANVTGLQTALDAKLPSANFTYANITGAPNLTVYLTTANASTTYQPLGNYATTSCLTFANITGKPTTLSGYGITDGYSTSNPSGYITAGANTFTGVQNLQDNELIRAKLRDYSESVSSPTISSGTLTLNLETSNIFAVNLNAAITTPIVITNVPASGSGASFTLIFTADGIPRSVSWPTSIKWAGGTPPTITSAIGKADSFAFFTSNGGTSWLGFVGGQNF